MSRTKNAFNIMKSSAILQVVMVICGLILPPMIIKKYGSDVNGLVSTIKQLLNYFSIVSLGLGAASQVALYKPLAENDTNKINGILSATRIFFNRTGYIFGFLVSVAAFIFPVINNNGIDRFTITSIIFICGIGSFMEYVVISKYKTLLIADQKNYVVSKIQTQGYIFNTIISVILILLNASIILVQLAATLVYLLRLLLTIKYIKKNYIYVDFKSTPDFNAIQDRWQAFGFQLPDLIISYTPIIIISLLIGYSDASVYSIYNMIFSSLSMIVGIFSAGFAPGFGNVLSEGDVKVLHNSFNTFQFIYIIISFFCYTCAMVLCLPFVSLYIKNTDGINYVIPSIAILFTTSGLAKSLRTPANTLVQASGKFKENKVMNFLEAVFNIVLSLILANRYGIAGILFASTITSLIRSILYILYSYKHILNINPIKDILIIIVNAIVMILIYSFIPKINCSNFIEWFIYSIIIGGSTLLTIVPINILMNLSAAKDSFKRIKSILNK